MTLRAANMRRAIRGTAAKALEEARAAMADLDSVSAETIDGNRGSDHLRGYTGCSRRARLHPAWQACCAQLSFGPG